MTSLSKKPRSSDDERKQIIKPKVYKVVEHPVIFERLRIAEVDDSKCGKEDPSMGRSNWLFVLAALGILSLSAIVGQSSAPVERPAASPFPSLTAAVASAQAALAACSAYKVSVAVVDSAGELKAALASDGAPPLTTELAWRKARTVSTFKKASSQTKLDPSLQSSLSSSLYSYYGGGLPLKDSSGDCNFGWAE
jgi:uncharacterized protein GlcG (DUF336 family)